MKFIHKDGRVIPIRDPGSEGQRSSVAHSPTKPPNPTIERLKATAKVQAAKIHEAAQVAKIHVNTQLKAIGTDKRLPVDPVPVNKTLDRLGLGLSVASGVIGAATFGRGMKSFVAGEVISKVLDVGGIAAAVGSVAGTTRKKERAKVLAKQEARNFAIGNGIYGIGLLGFKKNRQVFSSSAHVAATFAKKFIRRGF